MGTTQRDPIFLIGAARSGTSLLYKCLCLRHDVGYISNWVRKFPAMPALAALNRLARMAPASQTRVWFGGGSNAYVYGRRRSALDRMFPMPVEGEPVFRHCGIPEFHPDRARSDASVRLRASFTAITRAGGGAIFVGKRIANNRRIPLLHEAFPRARFVHIVRDGRAVAYSLSRVDWWEDSHVWWAGETPRAWAVAGRDPWEICARNWVEELHEIDKGLTVVPEGRVLRIAYEEVLRDPVGTLERVAGFGGMPADAGWRSRLQELSFPNQNEGWRAKLDPEIVTRVESFQRDELVERGYLT